MYTSEFFLLPLYTEKGSKTGVVRAMISPFIELDKFALYFTA